MLLDTPCIIFAGGKSSRMGEDKALLPFASYKTLTQFQYTRLKKIFKDVYISCKNSNKFDFKADFIEDGEDKNIYAPTVGFIAAFTMLQVEKIFVLSVDTPFVTEDVIQKLCDEDSANVDAVIAQTQEGIQPMCGIYHRSLVNEFEKMQEKNSHKLGFLLKNADTKYVLFQKSEAFFNLNHPHEYQKALSLI